MGRDDDAGDIDHDARRALAVIAGSQLLVMSLWFSASAVSRDLGAELEIAPQNLPLLTQAVQLGFVVGALAFAASAVADRVPARRLFIVSSTVGAVANLGVLTTRSLTLVVLLRFITGISLAGVYPSGMRAIAGWFKRRRGAALGILIGALAAGSALPNLISQTGLAWRGVIAGASLLAALGAVGMSKIADGPHAAPPVRFEWGHLSRVLANRGFRLATAGYLGHMWELYAMWTWVGAFLAASAAGVRIPIPLATFAIIAIGAPGAWVAGRWADQRGRTIVAGGSLVLSGSVAALTPLIFHWPAPAALGALLLWGATVVSDSAQFSAMVTEVVDIEVQGTALTLQTAMGFLLTLGSIGLVSWVAGTWGWQWAFAVLIPGPVVGIWAMVTLRRSEFAAQLASGLG